MGKIAPILTFVKKNVLIVICASIALLAIIARYWPINGYFSALQTQVDARKTAYTTLTGLQKKLRTLPLLDPLSTDAQPLAQFPTDLIINRGKIVTDSVHEESDKMIKAATGLVVHHPLIPGALPNGDTMRATYFHNKYLELMTYPGLDPEARKLTLPVTILHAGAPPTDLEIKAVQDLDKTSITNEKTLYDASGKPVNAPQVAAMILTAATARPDQMRSDAAMQNQMYIANDAFHPYPSMPNPPSTVSMFNAQIGMWLLQDVFTAIASANSDSKGGVPTSRIKNLLKIDFADEPLGKSLSPDAAAAAPDPLHPTIDLTKSATGHVSNGLYDVIPFNLRLIVDKESIPDILLALSRNRFITVLRVDVITVDSGAAVLLGFLYGDKPVVQINIACEELFFRSDTMPYMPDGVLKNLGIVTPQPGA